MSHASPRTLNTAAASFVPANALRCVHSMCMELSTEHDQAFEQLAGKLAKITRCIEALAPMRCIEALAEDVSKEMDEMVLRRDQMLKEQNQAFLAVRI